jgi:alpha-glutamyl/putrescinyl thymine pyrophosphorylase clade 1
MQPTPRRPVLDAYWRFAAERQQIFEARLVDPHGPWTEDPILARYKFCNTFRASDRISQYLISRVIYDPAASDLAPEDVFLRIVLFRLFSKESTWEALEDATGGVCRETLDTERLGDLLDELRREQPIYTAAFILCAHDAYGHRAKHRNHLELVRRMFAPGALGAQIARASRLEDVYEALRQWPMIGAFMGYQLAIDLNYSDHVIFDENDFTVPGPGAVRGLQKVFSDFGDRTHRQLIMDMVARQDEHFERLDLPWSGLFGRSLHAIDCQGLFCETDKYARVAFPELASNRVRIKQEFRNPKARIDLFYPPKWQINDRVPAATGPHVDAPSGQLSFADSRLRVVHDAPGPHHGRKSAPANPARLFDEPAVAVG